MAYYSNMYIIKATTGEQIKIDFDELAKLNCQSDTLILFRRGAMLRRLVGVVLEDEEAKKETPRFAGESEEQRLKRLREKKSEDIFKEIRNGLPNSTNQLRLG